MSDFMEFGFGENEDSLPQRAKRFKGKEGENYRVSFIWWPGLEDGTPDMDAATPKFVAVTRCYIAGVGYVIHKGPEWTKLAGGNQPKLAIATIIVVWPTTKDGGLDKDGFRQGKFDVLPWVFPQAKYDAIRPIHREFPLGQSDMTIRCTDSQYQKMDFSPCRDNLLRKILEAGDKQEDMKKRLINEASKIAATIREELARDMTLDQAREKMTGTSAAQPVAAAASEDVDNMLDDILDT